MAHKASFTVLELSKKFGFEFTGNGDVVISGVSPLDEPSLDHISYSKGHSIDPECFRKFGALIIPPNAWKPEYQEFLVGTVIFAAEPYAKLVEMIPLFFPTSTPLTETSIHPTAVIAPTAKIGKNVFIGPWVIIGEGCSIGDHVSLKSNITLYDDVVIGNNTVLHAGVVIREQCQIGAFCTLQPNVTIGADGFGYIPDKKMGLKLIPQVGIVVVEDWVDIGANSTIDRATLGATRVGRGTKIDNQVQIGHNSRIGSNSILCGQVAIAGSCTIGEQVVLAGNVGVADHLTIASGIRLGAKAGVTASLTEKNDYMGHPALPAIQYKKNTIEAAKLYETLRELRREVKMLKAKIAE